MKQLLVALVLGACLLVAGCNKKGGDELIKTGGNTPATAQEKKEGNNLGVTESTLKDSVLSGKAGPGKSTPESVIGSTTLQTTNPSIDSEGNMITKEAGKPAPEGRVWCDSCGGHLPKDDAVEKGGKTLCMACAEEAKG